MGAAVTAGAGFLLAVLWFDLMFDVQVLRLRGGPVPEAVLASVAGYYRRVTSEARPMNRLVAAAMLATLVAIGAQAAIGGTPAWVSVVSAAAALTGIGLAGARTVPAAVRLGGRSDPPDVQARLARAIGRDHLVCLAAIATLLVIQLGWG
ncbi:MAG TPA: hypothetical protein VKB57_01695 [Acidimicrobiales bacterium]|nr:hypothetical protein [Acidimicrobiales bacterium]